VTVSRGLGGDAIESKNVSLIPTFRLTIASLRCGSSNVPVEQPMLTVPFGRKQRLDSSGALNLGDGNEGRDGQRTWEERTQHKNAVSAGPETGKVNFTQPDCAQTWPNRLQLERLPVTIDECSLEERIPCGTSRIKPATWKRRISTFGRKLDLC
jgi:hypothetical protein